MEKLKRLWDEFAATWKKVIFEPEEFFAAFNPAEDWKRVFTFNLTCGLVSGLLTVVLTLFTNMGALVGHPVAVLLQTLFGGIVLFAAFRFFGGRGEVEGTIKMVGYTQAVRVFWAGPAFISTFLGLLVTVYQLRLLIAGGRAVHGLDASRSAAAVLLTAAVALGMAMIFSLLIFLTRLITGF